MSMIPTRRSGLPKSRNVLSAAGNDGLRFSHLPNSVSTMPFARKGSGLLSKYSAGASWKAQAFLREFRQLFLCSSLRFEKRCDPICVGSTVWRMPVNGEMVVAKDRSGEPIGAAVWVACREEWSLWG